MKQPAADEELKNKQPTLHDLSTPNDDTDAANDLEVDAQDDFFTNATTAFGDPRAVVTRWFVPHELDRARADRILTTKIKRISRSRAQRIVERGDFRRTDIPKGIYFTPPVTASNSSVPAFMTAENAQGDLDEIPASAQQGIPSSSIKPATHLPALTWVELWRLPPDSPEDLRVSPTIVVEDEDIVVINKPGDLAVHPSARYLYQTLTFWLRQRYILSRWQTATSSDEKSPHHQEQYPKATPKTVGKSLDQIEKMTHNESLLRQVIVGTPTAKRPHQKKTNTWNMPHPCHRLDRETSGILICAKSADAEATISRAFRSSTARKMYLAIARGQLTDIKRCKAPLALQGNRGLVRIRMIDDENGLPSHTDFIPLYYDSEVNRTLIACYPHTGRQHQIRAHLAILGFPIVGDKLYAMGDEYFDVFTRSSEDHSALDRDFPLDHHRQALHAYRLTILVDEDMRTFIAAMPDDMQTLLPSWQVSLEPKQQVLYDAITQGLPIDDWVVQHYGEVVQQILYPPEKFYRHRTS